MSHPLVQLALTRVGEEYVLGADVPLDDADWHGPWDCAEFGSWLVYQLSGRLYGCKWGTTLAKADPWTGWWARDAEQLGELLTVDQALGTAGTFLIRRPQGSTPGHLALSCGDGTSVEAMGRLYGVRHTSALRRSWTVGVRVPWIDVGPIRALTNPPLPYLRLGHEGDRVRELQERLAVHGFAPGSLDGVFGAQTQAAVKAFQAARNLQVDGIVGPKTSAALGM